MHIKHVLNFCLSHPHIDIYANMNFHKNMHNMFSTSQHFEWKFWCIPLGTTQNLFELVFLFLQKEAFAPTIIFPDVHDQEIDFRRKSGFPIFSSAEEFLLCSSFSRDQVLTSSLSKQPHIPTKFASSLTRYDTHKVHTAILSFSHLWGRLCLVNHLYMNVNMGTWKSSKFIIFDEVTSV